MGRIQSRPPSNGMALLEVAIAVAILGLASVFASLLLPDARRRARLGGSIQNLQQLGAAAAAFAADKENRVFSFDWEPGPHTCNGYVFPYATSRIQAAADQAVCILRERGNRPDITAVFGWVPHIVYSHLVLVDYLPEGIPSSVFVSPGDAPRLAWVRAISQDPQDRDTAYFSLSCRPASEGNAGRRWPYSSSYELQPSFFSPDADVQTQQGNIPTVAQATDSHRLYLVGTQATILGNRRMDEVRYPSHKAMMYETNQRFFGSRELFFMYPEARVPILCADGSVGVRSSRQANPGFYPNTPLSPLPTQVNYTPELSWETPTANGQNSEILTGVFRWTRSGLRGRDFAGPEIPWAP